MIKPTPYDDILEGLDAYRKYKDGKITLKTHVVTARPVKSLTANELIKIRRRLNVSATVFAHYLRTNPRTLENWEQGRAKPNAQATTLIRLVEKHPETLKHLATL